MLDIFSSNIIKSKRHLFTMSKRNSLSRSSFKCSDFVKSIKLETLIKWNFVVVSNAQVSSDGSCSFAFRGASESNFRWTWRSVLSCCYISLLNSSCWSSSRFINRLKRECCCIKCLFEENSIFIFLLIYPPLHRSFRISSISNDMIVWVFSSWIFL